MRDQRCEQYIKNLRAVRALSHVEIDADKRPDDLIEAIQQNARDSFDYMKENNALLDELIYSRSGETLTDDEIADLQEFAGELFHYSTSEDVGMAYKVHELLLTAARKRGDEPMMIRELYNTAITLFYLDVVSMSGCKSEPPFGARIRALFAEGASYLDRYESFDADTRGYIMRCLGNCKATLLRSTKEKVEAYDVLFRRAMAVFTSPEYRALDPDQAWDSFVYAMHMDRMTLLPYLREHADPEVAASVLESAKYVYAHRRSSEDERLKNWRVDYFYQAARFSAGECAASDVVNTLLAVIDHTDEADYTPQGIYNNLCAVAYILVYAPSLTEAENAVLGKKLQALVERTHRYIERIPPNTYPGAFSSAVRNLVATVYTDDAESSRNLLAYLLDVHKPTFVHSLMVANLTQSLFCRLLDTRPEALIGTAGCTTVEQLRARREELSALAYCCGLYHDVGKSMVASYINTNARRLIDEEFTNIQYHTYFGWILLDKCGHGDDYAIAALYHHRFYDGSGGYPRNEGDCPASMRCIVDAITVADSIDAATDNIGRRYNAAKSFDTVVGELRAEKGTRYAPDVVELFDDADFLEQIRSYLTPARLGAYRHAYSKTSDNSQK